MRRPRPRIGAYPRPSPRSQGGPAAVVVRAPADRDGGIPDIAVRRLVAPRSVSIEGGGVVADVVWQVLRRLPEPLVPTRLGPAIERVPGRRVEDVGRRRRFVGPGERPLTRAQLRAPALVHQVRRAAKHRELHVRLAAGAKDRDAVLAGLRDLHPRRRRIDPIVHVTRLRRDRHAHAPVEQTDHVVGLEIDNRARVEMKGAAVGEEHFRASVLRAESIAGEQRHRRRSGLGPPVAFEHDRAVDDGDVSGGIVGHVLGARGRDESEGSHAREESEAHHTEPQGSSPFP